MKKDGSKAWQFQAYLGVNELGKEVRTTRRGFATKKEAQLACSRLQYEVQKNGFQERKFSTFGEMYELWFEQYKNTVKESSYCKTREMIINHALPVFGGLRLDQISAPLCQDTLNKWCDYLTGYKLLKNYCSKVFKHAIDLQMVNDNPWERVTVPKRKEVVNDGKELNFFTKEELRTFLDYAKNNSKKKTYTFLRLLSFTGLRQGEALALTWNDIDFTNNTLTVSKTLARGENRRLLVQTPKTKASYRTISVDDETLLVLKEWRRVQKELYFMLGYNTLAPNQLVFSNERNEFIQLSRPIKWLNNIINQTGLKRITVHGLRHTHASILFEAGATIKDVQDRLGHSDIQTTMNIYTHITEKRKEETALKFAEYVNF